MWSVGTLAIFGGTMTGSSDQRKGQMWKSTDDRRCGSAENRQPVDGNVFMKLVLNNVCLFKGKQEVGFTFVIL